MINLVISLAVGTLGRGMNLHALENLSIIAKMVVLSWDCRSPEMKSIEQCDQGHHGIERGWSNP